MAALSGSSGQWSKLISQNSLSIPAFNPGFYWPLATAHFYGVTFSVIADEVAVIGLAPPVVALTVTL
jgi:hypothetical protein